MYTKGLLYATFFEDRYVWMLQLHTYVYLQTCFTSDFGYMGYQNVFYLVIYPSVALS